MSRLPLLYSFLLLALTLGACTPDDPFIPSPRPQDTVDLNTVAFLRVVHASPDAPDAVFTVDTTTMFGGAPQKYLYFDVNQAKYYPVDTTATGRTSHIAFRNGGSVVADASVTMKQGMYYTAYLYGIKGDYHVLFTTDTLLPNPPADSARYRIVHFSPDSPEFDIKEGADREHAATVVSGLAYGHASSYVRSVEHPIGAGTGLYIDKAGTDNEVIGVDPPFIVLPGGAVFTIVLTGNSQPKGNDPLIFLNLFQENRTPSSRDKLYGGLPIPIQFSGLRLINLVAGGDTTSLDVTFLDNLLQDKYIRNEYYRKDMTNSQWVVRHKFYTELQRANEEPIPPYFLLSLLLRNSYPFEVEIHNNYFANFDDYLFGYQTRLVDGPIPLDMEKNQRYTIYAYGPFDTTKAKATVVHDNTPLPTAGFTRLRFFHGSFRDSTLRLSLKIGSATSPQMSYGGAPDGVLGSFEVPAGTYSVQVVDQQGNTIHTQDNVAIDPDKTYMMAFSNGSNGDIRVVSAIPEEIIIK